MTPKITLKRMSPYLFFAVFVIVMIGLSLALIKTASHRASGIDQPARVYAGCVIPTGNCRPPPPPAVQLGALNIGNLKLCERPA